MLHSGVKENAVPGTSEVILDCRTVPGETADTLRASILDILHRLFDGTQVTYESATSSMSLPAAPSLSGQYVLY